MERIIINGFFAKGNCGDEAILQTWNDMLSPYYRIVASIDADLLVNNYYKKFELYNNIDIIQNRRVDIFCREDIKGYIVGGGGLGLGFGVEQLLHAKLRNKKRMYLGTVIHDEFFDGDESFIELNRQILNTFDIISLRDNYSKENLKKYFNIDGYFFPDVAFLLGKKEIEIKVEGDYVVIVIRDNGENDKESIKTWLDKITKYANDNNLKIMYIPFDKTDEILMKELNLEIIYDEIYWKPKEVKYLISKSKMTFTLGRFHPLIFSISSGVTTYFINCQKQDGEWRYTKEGKDKSYQLLSDIGLIDNYLTNNDLNVDFKICDKVENISNNIKVEMSKFEDMVINYLTK